MEQKQENILWVDWMRAVATVGVVLLHTASPLLYMYNTLPESHWWVGNIYDSMLRMCVPLFFMISGFLLLQKDYSLKTFFLKRVNKVLLPLLAWSVFFILWNVYIQHNSSLSISSFFSIFHKPAYYHLWFLYALIGIYLAVPLLRVIVQYGEKTVLHYGVALWFITASLAPMVEKFAEVKVGIDLRFMAGYSGFFLLGWILGKHSLSSRQAITASVLAFVCIVITAVGTYFLTIRNGGIWVGYFYGPTAPNVIFLSGSIFLLIKYAVENYRIAQDENVLFMVRSVSAASLGIYMIHTVFLYLLRHGYFGVYLFGHRWHPALSIPLVALVAFGLSYGTIHILRKNALMRRFIP